MFFVHFYSLGIEKISRYMSLFGCLLVALFSRLFVCLFVCSFDTEYCSLNTYS